MPICGVDALERRCDVRTEYVSHRLAVRQAHGPERRRGTSGPFWAAWGKTGFSATG